MKIRNTIFLFFLCLMILLPIISLENFAIDKESQGTATIDVIHHNPQDLLITIGSARLMKGQTSLSTQDFIESQTIHNRERSEISDGIFKTWDLKELGFQAIKKPDFHIIWVVEIKDMGTRHLKANLTEEEKAETGNFLKNFYLVIDGITYRSYQHPFFDDGCTVRAEIYGTEAEESFDEGSRTIIFSRVLSVCSIGNFIFWNNLNDANAIDSIFLIKQFRNLASLGKIGWYDEFYIIDGHDPDDPNDDYFQTNSKIYVATVTSLLENVDTCTDGYSKVVSLFASHGQNSGFLRPLAMVVYDTLAGANVYTHSGLAERLADMTEEGTDVFCWAKFCYSYKFTKFKDEDYHHNNLISWVYDNTAFMGTKNVEYDCFYDEIYLYGKITVESIFPAVADRFHYVHADDDMLNWDYKSGYFYI